MPIIAITTRSSTRVKAFLLPTLPPPPYFDINFPRGIAQNGKECSKENSKQYAQKFKQIFQNTFNKHNFFPLSKRMLKCVNPVAPPGTRIADE
jgi:hypothetical protein